MSKLVFFDVETFYGDGYSLSLKDVTTESYVRDSRFKVHGFGIAVGLDGSPKWVTGNNAEKVIKALPWDDIILVGHNLQFDGSVLNFRYGVKPKKYIDTLALSRMLVGPHSARHGLKYVAELLCGMTKMDELAKAYNKRDLPPEIERALADYTIGEPRWNEAKQLHEAGDIILTREIFKKMIPHVKKQQIDEIDWSIRAFTDPKLYMDTELLSNYGYEVAERKKQVLVEAGLESRGLLMSNDRYAEALENLGVIPPTKVSAKTGKVSYAFAKTDEAHIALLEHDNPDVQALVAARLEHKSTIEETRTKLYLEASTRGAWPVGYNYAGAYVTQRLSGNKGGGGNPQNIGRASPLRKAIYAEEGKEIGVADLSQIEARIVLWLGMQIAGSDSEEAKALEVMASGGDIYGWFGTKIYGYEITKEKTPHERQIAKSAVLGLGYGMGHVRFIEYCKQSGIKGVDEQFAKDIVKLYRTTFKGVAKFWKECQNAVSSMVHGEYGYNLPSMGHTLVTTGLDPLMKGPALIRPNGMTVKYPQLLKDVESGELTYLDGKTRVKLFGGKICENIVQAIAADILRTQLLTIDCRYPDYINYMPAEGIDEKLQGVRENCYVCMTTHDEVACLIDSAAADVREWLADKGKFKTISTGAFTDYILRIMRTPVPYMPGLPLDAETGTAYAYGYAK